MVSFDEFRRELRAFDDRRVVLKELRAELRKPLPQLRKEVKRSAVAKLPAAGGLGAWVARGTVTLSARDRGRTAGIRIKVSRKSTKNKADLKRLNDAGRVRHPLHGNRKHWYPQEVTPGYFDAAFYAQDWHGIADRAVDRAFDKLRRG